MNGDSVSKERRTATATLIAVACAGVLVVGCDDKASVDAGDRPPSTQPTSPAVTPTPSVTPTPPVTPPVTPTPAPPGSADPTPDLPSPAGDTLVVYRRTGGIAGLRDEIVIRADGRVTRTSRAERCDFRLNPRQLADLRADLDRADFATLRGRPSPGNVSDGFSYLVVYRGTTVRAYDLAIPDRLQPAMSRLVHIVTQPCLR